MIIQLSQNSYNNHKVLVESNHSDGDCLCVEKDLPIMSIVLIG